VASARKARLFRIQQNFAFVAHARFPFDDVVNRCRAVRVLERKSQPHASFVLRPEYQLFNGCASCRTSALAKCITHHQCSLTSW